MKWNWKWTTPQFRSLVSNTLTNDELGCINSPIYYSGLEKFGVARAHFTFPRLLSLGDELSLSFIRRSRLRRVVSGTYVLHHDCALETIRYLYIDDVMWDNLVSRTTQSTKLIDLGPWLNGYSKLRTLWINNDELGAVSLLT